MLSFRAFQGGAVSQECLECGISDEETYLYRCPMCHKYVCEECRFTKSGQTFCSRGCGEMFFHHDEDDPEDMEE